MSENETKYGVYIIVLEDGDKALDGIASSIASLYPAGYELTYLEAEDLASNLAYEAEHFA